MPRAPAFLAAAEVADFLADAKRVVGVAPRWTAPHQRRWTRLVLPIENSEGVALQGTKINVGMSLAEPDHMSVVLLYRDVRIFAWDFGGPPHRNMGCPPGFPDGIIPTPHVHVWVGPRDATCVKQLSDAPADVIARVEAFLGAACVTMTDPIPDPGPPELF